MSSFVVADRVQETCNAPGLGVVTLLGASPQFQSFSATIGNTNTTTYAIADVVGVNWEVGIGTYSSSGNTLTRTTVLASSNGGAAVNFSSGTQNVWVDYPAEYAVYASNNSSQVLGQALISNGVGIAPTWANINSTVGSPGYYGAFYDTTNQTAASTTVNYLVGCALTSISNQVSISSGRITVANAGVYNFQFSLQFSNSTASIATTTVWIRYNGVDVANSASSIGIPAKHGSLNSLEILALNEMFNMSAGDYVELWWQSDVAGVTIATIPATTSPTVPQSPAVIYTMQQLTQIGIGYYGLTSTTSTLIATGSKTFTTNLSETSTAFTVGTRVRLAYSTIPADFMEGVITAFTGTTLTVLVDSLGGSGTFASWTISVAGIQGSNGVTSFSGNSTGLTPSTATTGAISLGGTLNVANGGTGVAGTLTGILYGNGTSAHSVATTAQMLTGIGVANTTTSGYLSSTDWNTFNGKQAAGSYVTVGGALGTPSSGTVTNLTGTASININGTVGATTANTGKFTTLEYTSTLTGGTGILNIGSGQLYKDASGNVGIGTSSPNNKLTVGTPNLNGGSSCVASFSGANVANLNTPGMVVITPTDSIAADIGGSIGFAANGTIVYPTGTIAGRRENATANNYASYMQFSTCSSGGTVVEKMRLDASGNLLVGATSVTSGGKILVVADSSNVAYFRNTAGTGVYLVSGGNSWTASSDERIKTDLIPIENGLEKVNSLRSVTGRYKTDEVGTSRSFLIAQDVQAVLPEAVSVQDDDLGTLGVAYTEVIPLLVASIKELKAIIDTQQEQINSLLGK